jgi:uncharacterized protein (DUF2141 family)
MSGEANLRVKHSRARQRNSKEMNMRMIWTTGVLFTAMASANAANLTVKIDGLHNTIGNVMVCLWDKGDGFPHCDKVEPLKKIILKASEAASPVSFSDLPDGTYAVGVLHDENMNGKLDTNAVGAPAEGTGVSNNVVHTFSAPGFKESSFQLSGQKTVDIKITY